MNEHIYIAEDEDNIRETVKTFLESENYKVTDFENGDLLYAEFVKTQCDLVILDILMPGSTGFEITKKIRKISTVPIIILTAKDSDLDYATGINLGSDDYFTKPFSAISLVMRVKAMIRRVNLDKQAQNAQISEVNLNYGDISINKKTMKVLHEENPLDLTPTEYNLLIYLIENKDRAISRDELLDEIWGYSKDVETRACDDTVRRIRKKLADSRVQVETIWGFGFTIKEENP
ncbi:response regulator [Alkalibaculum sp. M08DMB]|uniref:Stage 0 sporulation protein A homolog n=1 Tax=Alkalibaculum sporogenes TaxID=2655001 RepID=A0A6A7K854_9FIRM|nr:response regulator [Alkalibaculum sporogenes]